MNVDRFEERVSGFSPQTFYQVDGPEIKAFLSFWFLVSSFSFLVPGFLHRPHPGKIRNSQPRTWFEKQETRNKEPETRNRPAFFLPLSQLSPYFRHHKDVDFTGYKGLRYLIRQARSPEAIKCKENRFESLALFHSQPLYG